MPHDLIATATVTVSASRADVWKALVTPALIRQYMFGAEVTTNWREGSPIVWKGEWQGKPYEDRGVILKLDPTRLLQYSHCSPLSGLPDAPENYHTVRIELDEVESGTRLVLTQDNNATEQARAHSEENWSMMLAALKKVLEE